MPADDDNTVRFQPTLPARGATNIRFCLRDLRLHFNPRSPHGERQATAIGQGGQPPFQPTLPARGATAQEKAELESEKISTHAPRTGSDSGRVQQ